MNHSKWAAIFSTQIPYRVEIVKDILDGASIASVVMDQQDSAYPGVIGEIQVYVKREDVIRAKHLIDEQELWA